MNRIKISSGLAAIVLLASIFAGWQTLLIVVALMLLFCDIDDKIQGVMVKVIAFYAGLTLFTMAWNLIVNGVDVVFSSIDNLVATINSYLEYADQLDISNFTRYFVEPVKYLVSIADTIMTYLLALIKFGFIIATLKNKKQKDNVILNKINSLVEKVIGYINNLEIGNNSVDNNQM